MLEKVKEVLDR